MSESVNWREIVKNITSDLRKSNSNATTGEQLEAIYNYVETNYSCEMEKLFASFKKQNE